MYTHIQQDIFPSDGGTKKNNIIMLFSISQTSEKIEYKDRVEQEVTGN